MSGKIPELVVTFTAEAIRAYGGPGRHLHADEDVARKLGFPALVSWGTLTLLPFAELLARIAGPDWEVGGMLSARLSKPVCAGDVVTYSATDESKPDGAKAPPARTLALTATSSRVGIVASAQAVLRPSST